MYLLLSDSLVNVLALMKGRGSSNGVYFNARALAALQLALGCQVCLQWVPTCYNPADAPSRGRRYAGV